MGGPAAVGGAGLGADLDSAFIGLAGLDADVDLAVGVVVGGGEVESDDAAEQDRGEDERQRQRPGGQGLNPTCHRVSQRCGLVCSQMLSGFAETGAS